MSCEYIIPMATNCAFRLLKKAQFVIECGIYCQYFTTARIWRSLPPSRSIARYAKSANYARFS